MLETHAFGRDHEIQTRDTGDSGQFAPFLALFLLTKFFSGATRATFTLQEGEANFLFYNVEWVGQFASRVRWPTKTGL